MKNLKVIRSKHMDALRAAIGANIDKYERPEPWVTSFFESEWEQSSGINIPDVELRLPNGNDSYDLENTKRLYTALEGLTPAQAADERLWVHLAHTRFWDYMVRRWPVAGKPNQPVFISERYFFMRNRSRAIFRHGIARLWWYGHVSFDARRDDSFELTRQLLATLDVTQSIVERSVSNVRALTLQILDELHERDDAGQPFTKRGQFRELMRYFNAVSGVTVLDTLADQEIRSMIRQKIEEIEAAATTAAPA